MFCKWNKTLPAVPTSSSSGTSSLLQPTVQLTLDTHTSRDKHQISHHTHQFAFWFATSLNTWLRPCEDLSFIRASRLFTASDHGSWGGKNCGKWAALRIAHKRIIRWTRIRRIQPLEGRTRYRLAFHRGQFLRRPCGFSRHWREPASVLVKETPALGRTRPGPWPVGWHAHAHAAQRLFG